MSFECFRYRTVWGFGFEGGWLESRRQWQFGIIVGPVVMVWTFPERKAVR